MRVDRPDQLAVGAGVLPLPVYFPSVSSVKTMLPPWDYVQLLSSLIGVNDQFLVSAFDLASIDDPERGQELLAAAQQKGAVTLMDSGNYESFWRDAQADWKQADFHKMLKGFSFDLAFCFDEQAPPADNAEHVALVVERWRADQRAATGCQIIPILHADAVELPRLCATVADQTGVTMIAVAERKLGHGILERARAVKAIRVELNKLGRYVVLHLLGTGNPTSIALYTAMGADSFDGLEWCQTVVDHDTGLLHHFSQADFFAKQTGWGASDLSFQAKTLAHNLEFFADWMRRLRDAVHQEKIMDFCRQHLPAHALSHCFSVAGWGEA